MADTDDDKKPAPPTPASDAPVDAPARGAGERKGSALKLAAVIVPLLLGLAFIMRPTLEQLLTREGPSADDSDAVKNAHAFQQCVGDVLRKSEKTSDKAKIEFGELKSEQDRERAIEHAELTPDERKSVFEGCKSMFPAAANQELNAHLTLVEGEHEDPVARDVRVAIEAGARYVSPGANGEAVVPYYPSTCGKAGCAVTVERSSGYELAAPSVFDKDALGKGVTIKLRRKAESLTIALGSRARTPHVWIEGTNPGAQLWNPGCQPNDGELRCRRVQAVDGSASLQIRGALSSLTLRLSPDGDDWSAAPLVIDDVAAQLQNGILRLPEPEPVPGRPPLAPCTTDPAFKALVRQFSGWDTTRKLDRVSATAKRGGYEDVKATPALSPDETAALAGFLTRKASAGPACAETRVTAASIDARAQR